MDQPGGIGLFIVPCVPYISLFIVEYCMNVRYLSARAVILITG